MADEAARSADYVRQVRDAVNTQLHFGFGAAPCYMNCPHYVVAQWTALGIANVFARRAALIDGGDRG